MYMQLNFMYRPKDISDNAKAGVNNMAESHIGQSGGHTLPKFLNKKNKHDARFPFPAMKTNEAFDNPALGPELGLQHEIWREFDKLKDVVHAEVRERQSEKARTVARWMLMQNELFLNGWLEAISKQYTHLMTKIGYTKPNGMNVATTVSQSLFEMIAKERAHVNRVLLLVKDSRARALGAVLELAVGSLSAGQHHETQFYRAPRCRFKDGALCDAAERNKQQCQGKVEIMKKEVKQLTKESRTRAKKLDSLLKTLEANK
jgi:hypothetical protein